MFNPWILLLIALPIAFGSVGLAWLTMRKRSYRGRLPLAVPANESTVEVEVESVVVPRTRCRSE